MAGAIDRARAREAFEAYVAPYDASNPRIKLKIEHTYRVAELCERIARSEALSAQDIDLAWLCGLLHDIGRFEQVRRWNTFSDAASAPHALLGVRVLFGEGEAPQLACDEDTGRIGVIRQFVSEDDTRDALIRTAVATHSNWRLPEELDARTRMFCDILRDADKVDILKAVTLEPTEAIFGVSEEAMRASTLSSAARAAFTERRCMRRDERRSPADVLASFACFCFELVYAESRMCALEQGCVFQLLALPFSDAATREELARMARELRIWLESGRD